MEFSTSCGQCVFVQKLEGKQVGCQFNRLEKYQENGVEITYDEQGNCIIHNRICNASRKADYDWGNGDRKSQVLKEIAVRVKIVIPVQNTTLDELSKSLDMVKQLDFPITGVHLILNDESITKTQLISLLKSKDLSCYWHVRVLHQKAPDEFNAVCFELFTPDPHAPTYAIAVEPGQFIPKGIVSLLNHWVNTDMRQVYFVEAVRGIHLWTAHIAILQSSPPDDIKHEVWPFTQS